MIAHASQIASCRNHDSIAGKCERNCPRQTPNAKPKKPKNVTAVTVAYPGRTTKPTPSGENRTNQWARSSDRREMMAEDDPTICWHKIFAVVFYHGRRGALVVEREHLRRQPFAVEPVTDRRRAKSSDDYPKRADL